MLKLSLSTLYTLILSLWIGGMAIFTFVVTPAIFKSFNRNMAGEIVGKLFPGYFAWTLVLSALALVIFFLLNADKSSKAFHWSLALLTCALIANAYVSFKLYPDIVRIKQEIATFDRAEPDSPARQTFRRLHGISAVVNLFVLTDGAALFLLSRKLLR